MPMETEVWSEEASGLVPVEAKQTDGSPQITQSGSEVTTNTVETAPLGSLKRYSEEFMADRPDMPADKSTSMTGLRAAEASKGLLYASGKYWKENPNAGQEGQSDFLEIDKGEWNSIKRSDQHAQEFAAQKVKETVDAINATDTEVTPADTANPVEKESTRRTQNWWRSL